MHVCKKKWVLFPNNTQIKQHYGSLDTWATTPLPKPSVATSCFLELPRGGDWED